MILVWSRARVAQLDDARHRPPVDGRDRDQRDLHASCCSAQLGQLRGSSRAPGCRCRSGRRILGSSSRKPTGWMPSSGRQLELARDHDAGLAGADQERARRRRAPCAASPPGLDLQPPHRPHADDAQQDEDGVDEDDAVRDDQVADRRQPLRQRGESVVDARNTRRPRWSHAGSAASRHPDQRPAEAGTFWRTKHRYWSTPPTGQARSTSRGVPGSDRHRIAAGTPSRSRPRG